MRATHDPALAPAMPSLARTLVLSLLVGLGVCTAGGTSMPHLLAPPTRPHVARQAQGAGAPYTLRSLRGAHGFTYSGTVAGLGAVASSGRIRFDGRGNLAAAYTTSVGGTAFTGSFVGTYTVHQDGTGSVLLSLPRLGLQARGDFVLVDGGRGTFFTSTDAGFSVAGSTRRM